MNNKDTAKGSHWDALLGKLSATKPGYLVRQVYQCLRDEGIRSLLRKVMRKLNIKLSAGRKIEPKDISFSAFVRYARLLGGRVFLPQQLQSYASKPGRKILFVSHEADLTGAPIVLRNFAMSVLRQGDQPIFLSPNPGKLAKSITGQGIPLIIHPGAYTTEFIKVFAPLFDLIVVNTIVGAPVINSLAGADTPILWWIHEAEFSYHEGLLDQLPAEQPGNVNIYCVGDYADKVLKSHRPAYRPQQLLYHTLDSVASAKEDTVIKKDARITFGLVGTMHKRKGADILADAIMLLPEDILARSRFLFIGRAVETDVMKKIHAACAKYPQAVSYLGEIANEKLMPSYANMDCLLCPSRDDPMPCSITEALLQGVPAICSESTGYAKIIRETGCGATYSGNEPALLAEAIQRFIGNSDALPALRELARQTYEQYFSQKIFDNNSQKAISDTLAHTQAETCGTVSVVIPAFNAGSDASILLRSLRAQTGLESLQIIVVDSGSTDGTVQIAKDHGCQVIEIPSKDFSHSYARNLGAQAATGDYLLFITQDAVPSSEVWIKTMLNAMQATGAAAASCREEPKPDCDLFGRITCYGHNKYIGILHDDRLTQRPIPWNNDDARLAAQLNDVACLMPRRIFNEYGYRGDYAEDLDLGLRLLKDRHRLLLMSSAPVIHSHTRSASYHFKRAITDTVVLNKLLPKATINKVYAQDLLNKLATIMLITFHAVRLLSAVDLTAASPKDLKRTLKKCYCAAEKASRNLTGSLTSALLCENWPCGDGGMAQIMKRLLGTTDSVCFNSCNFRYVTSFTADLAVDYFQQQNAPIDREQLCQMHINRMGQAIGLLCGEYLLHNDGANEALTNLIQEYTQGV